MNADASFFKFLKKLLPTKIFLKWQYYIKTGQKLNLKNPRGFNEKLNWLKVNCRDSSFKKLVDKYEVRDYIKDKVGDQHLNELYGVFNNPDEIPLGELPDQFVLKGTHGSGMVIICDDKHQLDWYKAKRKMESWLEIDWYQHSREWVYKGVKPRIICEKSLLNEKGHRPIDYRFFCFNGVPKFVEIGVIRNDTECWNFYDLDWNLIPLEHEDPGISVELSAPDNFSQLLNLARVLSQDFIFVRVDLYSLDSKAIFGELTFFPDKGLLLFKPDKYEKLFGDYLELPR